MSTASQPRVSWRLALACAVVLTTMFAVQNWLATPTPPTSFDVAFERQVIVWGCWLLLVPLVIAVARRNPVIDAPRKRWFARQLVLATAFALAHSWLVSVIRHLLGVALVPTITEGMLNLLFTASGRNFMTYAFISTSYHAVAYHRAVRERDVRAARLELDLAEAKLSNLEGQLRPHFLFNTLNSIAALIRTDPQAAEEMVEQLSDLLRASLRANPAREVRLDEEMRLAEQYLAIQRQRFQDRLSVSLRATDDVRQAYVPHLILQPLVENAVRHGIAPRESGGSVWVTADRPNGSLRIIVEDDGVGVSDEPSPNAGGGVGLGGLRSRLAHLYGSAQRVEVAPRNPTGTRVTIELPYRRESSVVDAG